MKRSMAGGAHRGPPAHSRQRRTLRFMQILLAVIAAALFAFAGYSWGRATGWEQGRASREIDAPARPGPAQVIVLAVLGAGALAGAWLIGGPGPVRMPTPARLEELTGRARQAAAEREPAAPPGESEPGSA
jgi:hypothetical protein